MICLTPSKGERTSCFRMNLDWRYWNPSNSQTKTSVKKLLKNDSCSKKLKSVYTATKQSEKYTNRLHRKWQTENAVKHLQGQADSFKHYWVVYNDKYVFVIEERWNGHNIYWMDGVSNKNCNLANVHVIHNMGMLLVARLVDGNNRTLDSFQRRFCCEGH